jgi:hypothetical protein
MRLLMPALRIAIAVAIINATGRTALVYWSYQKFKDEAQQLARFGADASTDILHANAFAKAVELMIPISEEQIVVTRDGTRTSIQASYQHPVEYFPHRRYPLKLSFNVDGEKMAPFKLQ